MRIRLFSFLGILVLLGVLIPGTSDAQQNKDYQPYYSSQPGSGFIADPYYDLMTEQLIANPAYFNFGFFRGRYVSSRRYDPVGDGLQRTMLNLAYRIQTSEDPEVVKESRREYDDILKAHLANMNVVTQALSLARDDKRFGNVEFLELVRDGLLKEVVNSGDGRSLTSAYVVISLAEETLLLNRMGFKVVRTVAAKEGIIYYNMHDVIDEKNEEARTIFVDITRPMSFLERQQKLYTQPLNIPRQ